MKRRLFNMLVLVSLVLATILAGLSIRSFWIDDWISYRVLDAVRQRWTMYDISSGFGTIYVSYSPFVFSSPHAAEAYAQGKLDTPGLFHTMKPARKDELDAFKDSFLHRMNFALIFERGGYNNPYEGTTTYRFDRALIPDWFILLILLVLPTIALLRIRRRAALLGQKRCLNCGYDLRATPDRCPECVMVPSTN